MAIKTRSIEVEGILYRTFTEACKSYNLPEARVRGRLKVGWTTDQSFELVPPPLGFVVQSKTYKSVADAAKAFDIHSDTARHRHRQGWSPEQVVGLVPPPEDTRKRSIKLEGILYRTFTEACKSYNLPEARVRGRLKIGWTMEESLEIIKRPRLANSISAIAKTRGLSPTTVYKRMSKGSSLEDALSKPPKAQSSRVSHPVQVSGKVYKSLYAASKALGLSSGAVYKRIKKGWSIDQALQLEPPPKSYTDSQTTPVSINGKTFQTSAEAARAFGISPSTFRGRIHKGWTPEQAAELQPHPKSITLDGKHFDTLSHAARAYNVSEGTALVRHRNGWSIEQCLGIAAAPAREKSGTLIKVDGNIYQSHTEAAEAYGVKPNTASCRLRDGWSIEEAFGAKDRPKSKHKGIDIVVSGMKFPSLQAAASHFDLDPRLTFNRLKAGYTNEEVFGLEEINYLTKPKTISLNGAAYPSIAEAARQLNIDKYVINARINRYGWSIEEAFEIDPRPGYEKGIVGIAYRITNTENQKKYIGVTMGTIDQRFQQHVDKALSGKRFSKNSLQAAIVEFGKDAFIVEIVGKAQTIGELGDLEVKLVKDENTLHPHGYNLNRGGSGSRTKGILMKLDGQSFPSKKAACDYFGVSWTRVKGRLRSGWSPEQAYELAPPPNNKSLSQG